MKKITLIIISAILLTACSSVENSTPNNSDISDILSENSSLEEIAIDTENQEIKSAKCYKVDFQEISEDSITALFKAVPQKAVNEFGTTKFTAENEKCTLTRSSGAGGKGTYYTVIYYTTQGDDFDTAAYGDYSEIAVNSDLSFLKSADAEKKIADIFSEFMPTGTAVKAYAITADAYSEMIMKKTEADREWNERVQETLGETFEEKAWSPAADYYYFTIEQTVDGIPIQAELIGDIDKGTQTWGSEGSAVLSAEGLGYLRVFSPYKIVGEVETSEKIISLSDAEQIFNERNNFFLTQEEITINNSRLVYAVLRAENDSLILTPCWEFRYNDDFYFYINAYTGEGVT